MRNLSCIFKLGILFPSLTLVAANSRAQETQPAVQATSSIGASVSTAPTSDQPNPALPTGSCAMRVYTAQSVAGVTTKSGFAKFALGTLLPSIAGSVGGSHDLATQGSIAGNNATANRASDVPQAVSNAYTQSGQASFIRKFVDEKLSTLGSAPAVFDEGVAPTNGLDAVRFGLTNTQCVRILTIDSITFEHSKDYKARNAIVVFSNLVEYSGGKKKPAVKVYGEARSPITPFAVEQETSSSELKAELDGAFNSAVIQLFQKFEKKRK